MQARHVGRMAGSCLAAVALVGCRGKLERHADELPIPARERGAVAARSLLEILSASAHSPEDERSWRVILDRWCFREGVPRRDTNIAKLKGIVESQPDPSQTRCLVLDFVYDHYCSPVYEHVALYSATDAAAQCADRLEAPDFVRVDWQQWPMIEGAAKELFAEGGSPGVRNTGGLDATVVSHFDGVKWQDDCWFYLLTYETYKTAPKEAQALLRLLYFVNYRLEPRVSFGDKGSSLEAQVLDLLFFEYPHFPPDPRQRQRMLKEAWEKYIKDKPPIRVVSPESKKE